MSTFEPKKLTVEFREGVTTTEPVIPRRYTLTHSDITAELFLTIGLNFAFDQITPMRDEVLGQWNEQEDNYSFSTFLSIDGNGQANPIKSAIRNSIFVRELPLALEAIRYGDGTFFSAHPELDQCPIMVYFISESEKYSRKENWGTFSDYITSVG